MMRTMLFTAVVAQVALTLGCAAECRSLHDCPGSLSCNSEGACVPLEDPAPRQAPRRVDVGETETPIDDGFTWMAVSSAHLRGRIGPQLIVDTKTVEIYVDSWGVTAYGDGDGAKGMALLSPMDADGFQTLLTAPGRTTVDGNVAYGITCTLEEEWVQHFDEASSVVVVDVSEPDDAGETTVEITQQSPGGTDVILTMTGTMQSE